VLGVRGADTAENVASGDDAVITLVSCPMPPHSGQGPRLEGTHTLQPMAGSLLAELCGINALRAEFFCSYETNPDYLERWQAAGLRVSARGAQGELRAFELPDHRFFIATLFQPQLSSRYSHPHPLITGFLRACLAMRA
jgi:CTP synthase (UTP-ammonia lyase)